MAWVPSSTAMCRLISSLTGPVATIPSQYTNCSCTWVPLYSNAAGVIPIVHALMEKGMAIGTVLAFMMAVTALSLPEAIILKNVLNNRLLAVFFGIVQDQ